MLTYLEKFTTIPAHHCNYSNRQNNLNWDIQEKDENFSSDDTEYGIDSVHIDISMNDEKGKLEPGGYENSEQGVQMKYMTQENMANHWLPRTPQPCKV